MEVFDDGPEWDEELGPEARMYKDRAEREERKASKESISRCLRCNTPQLLKFDDISNFPYMICPKCYSLERF